MTAQLPNLKVAPERLEQLKAIASKLDIPLAEVVGVLIRHEIERGTIPDSIPNVRVQKKSGKVRIEVDDEATRVLSIKGAQSLAETIERAAAGTVGGMLDLDEDWTVMRVGNGVRIEKRTFTRDVARDVARLIRAACLN